MLLCALCMIFHVGVRSRGSEWRYAGCRYTIVRMRQAPPRQGSERTYVKGIMLLSWPFRTTHRLYFWQRENT